jgi:hypothetical protein
LGALWGWGELGGSGEWGFVITTGESNRVYSRWIWCINE